jgi:hypothetical protein
MWLCSPARAMASSGSAAQRGLWPPHSRGLSTSHTRRATVGRTPLDECSVHRRDLYLTTNNTHNRQTSMPALGFEPTIAAVERPYTYALDRAATGTKALKKLRFITNIININPLHVSAQGCHLQGVFQIKEIQVNTLHRSKRHTSPLHTSHFKCFVWTRSLRITKDRDRCLYTYCIQNKNSYKPVPGTAIT